MLPWSRGSESNMASAPTASAAASPTRNTRIVIDLFDSARATYVRFERRRAISLSVLKETVAALRGVKQSAAASKGGVEKILGEIVSCELFWDDGMFPCAACGQPAVRAVCQFDLAPDPWTILYLSVPTCDTCSLKVNEIALARLNTYRSRTPTGKRLAHAATENLPSDVERVRGWDIAEVTARFIEGIGREIAVEKVVFAYLPQRLQPPDLSESKWVKGMLKPVIQRTEYRARRDWEAKNGRQFQLRCVGCDGQATAEYARWNSG